MPGVGGTALNASFRTGAYHGEMAWNQDTDVSGGSGAYHRAFHDVVTGDNSGMWPTGLFVGYRAGPGWDPVTGWGSPDAQVLVPLLARGG